MKTRKKIKKEKKGEKIIKEYVAFENKKKVFWRITIATLIISIMGLPILLKDETFLKYFLIIWILQAVYILLYIKYKRRTK